MKLSTRSRYGLKAVVDLAVSYGEGPVPLTQLAHAQGVSEGYLEQLLRLLKTNGLIDAARGALGGYSLSRPPEEIDVGTVLRVLEGSTNVVDCVGDVKGPCDNACTCSARPLFMKLQTRINDVLDGTTIAELAEDYINQRKRMEHAKGLS